MTAPLLRWWCADKLCHGAAAIRQLWQWPFPMGEVHAAQLPAWPAQPGSHWGLLGCSLVQGLLGPQPGGAGVERPNALHWGRWWAGWKSCKTSFSIGMAWKENSGSQAALGTGRSPSWLAVATRDDLGPPFGGHLSPALKCWTRPLPLQTRASRDPGTKQGSGGPAPEVAPQGYREQVPPPQTVDSLFSLAHL